MDTLDINMYRSLRDVGFNGSIPVQSPRKPIGAVRGAHDGNLIKEQLEEGGIGEDSLWSTNSLRSGKSPSFKSTICIGHVLSGYVENYQRGQ